MYLYSQNYNNKLQLDWRASSRLGLTVKVSDRVISSNGINDTCVQKNEMIEATKKLKEK